MTLLTILFHPEAVPDGVAAYTDRVGHNLDTVDLGLFQFDHLAVSL